MTVAVCATVLNEARDAKALADSLRSQAPAPDELVIVGRRIDRWNVRDSPRCPCWHGWCPNHRSAGRQYRRRPQPRRARDEIRAHCLHRCGDHPGAGLARRAGGRPWSKRPRPRARLATSSPPPARTVEVAIGAVGLPLADEIDPAQYPPSSGSVLMRRRWLDHVGGYPEWLDYGEDLWLDRMVWSEGGWFVHAPGADVWNRPRSNLSAFFRQYYRYASGDGRAGMLGKRHAVRFAAYSLVLRLARRPTWAGTALLLLLGYRYRTAPDRAGATLAARQIGSARARPNGAGAW